MMPYIRGYEEDGFVKQLDVTRQSLEIISPEKVFSKALITNSGTILFLQILVWHTKTSKTVFKPLKRISKSEYLNTNLGPLTEYW